MVEVLDVAGQFADAASGDPLGERRPKLDPLEPVDHLLAIEVDDLGLADGVELGPVSPQALDRLGAIADEAAALQLERAQRANEFGFQRGAELVVLAANDVSDRERVAWVGLARALAAALAVRAPSRDVQDLMPGRGERADQRAAVAARALDADQRCLGAALGQPTQQTSVALRAVAMIRVPSSPPRSSSSAAACMCLWTSMPANTDDLLTRG